MDLKSKTACLDEDALICEKLSTILLHEASDAGLERRATDPEIRFCVLLFEQQLMLRECPTAFTIPGLTAFGCCNSIMVGTDSTTGAPKAGDSPLATVEDRRPIRTKTTDAL